MSKLRNESVEPVASGAGGGRSLCAVLSFGAGLAWAGLTFASLPLLSVWWLGLVAPLPIVLIAWTTRRAFLAAAGVGAGTLPFWIYHHTWVSDVSMAGVFPLVGYLGLWMPLVVLAVARVKRVAGGLGPAVVVPTVWVGLEYVRGELVLEGYSWFLAGHAMIESVTVARAAAVGGVYFVSWLVVSLSGVLLARRYGNRLHRRVGLAVSLMLVGLLVVSLTGSRTTSETGKRLRVAALQTNVPQSNKVFPSQAQLAADFRELISLADEAAESGADLLVTPETVLPGGLLAPDARAVIDEPFGAAMLDEQQRLGIPMLVGCTSLGGLRVENDRAAWDDTFNSVFLLVNGRVSGPRYDKLRPTPFGETLPYVQSLPWLRDLVLTIGLGASGMDFGLTPGEIPTSFVVPVNDNDVVVTTPICFESSMAPTVRRLVNASYKSGRPTELLGVVTNDGWFGRFDPGRAMHLLQARWRCIEHGLPMIRCANTGVSAIIDRDGRVLASLDPREAGVLVAEVHVVPSRTLYQTVGDRFGAACAGLTLAGLILSLIRWRQAHRTTAAASDAANTDGDER